MFGRKRVKLSDIKVDDELYMPYHRNSNYQYGVVESHTGTQLVVKYTKVDDSDWLEDAYHKSVVIINRGLK
jgi:hypothetical protein